MAAAPPGRRRANLFCLDAGLAFIGEELEPKRSVRICIDGGVIASIEHGRDSDIVVTPGFVNAHIHVLDYGLAGLASRARDPRELLEWPNGLKARGIRLAYCRVVSSLPRLFRRLRRSGYALVVSFVEGGGTLCRLVKSVARENGIHLLAYGRGEPSELEGCDGLGAPTLLGGWARIAREAASKGLRVAAHISETVEQALQDDYLAALSLRLDHAVHLTHAPCRIHETLAEAGVLPVYAPLANLIHWSTEPEPCAPRYALGGDNAGWCPQSPWELMRWVVYRERRRLGLRSAVERALRALTTWPLEKFMGIRGIVEGEKPVLTVLHAPEIVHAIDPLAALVLIGDSSMVVDVLAHFEAYG